MESLLSIGQDVFLVVVGLIARFLIAVVGFAALLVPIVLVVALWQKAGLVHDRLVGLGRVGTLKWLRDAYYAPWHTWLLPVGTGLAQLGLDGLGERLLSKVTVLEIAAPGTQLKAGDPVATVTCGEWKTTLRTPAAALVVAVNDEVRRRPQWLHRDPYRRGWLALIAPYDRSYEKLRRGEPARRWLGDEERRLDRLCEHELGYAAADGGDLVGPAHGLLSPARWSAIVRRFLETPEEGTDTT